MNFKSYVLTFIGAVLLGCSFGYVIGFYIGRQQNPNPVLFYCSVPILAISSFLILYSVLYLKK